MCTENTNFHVDKSSQSSVKSLRTPRLLCLSPSSFLAFVGSLRPLLKLSRNYHKSREVAYPAVEARPTRGALPVKCLSPSIYQGLLQWKCAECIFWLFFLTRPSEPYEKFLAPALRRDTCSVQNHRLPSCFGAAKNNIWGGFLSPAGRRNG